MILLAIGLIMIGAGVIILLWPEGKKDEQYEEDRQNENAGRTEVKGGAIIMIGPIPIVMGSDYRITILLMLIALAIMIIWAFAFKI